MIYINLNILVFAFIIIGVKVVGFLKKSFYSFVHLNCHFYFLKQKLNYIQIIHLLLMI